MPGVFCLLFCQVPPARVRSHGRLVSENCLLESRNYVHVEVKDLLSRFSICQEKANSFTSQPRLADGIRYTHGDLEKIRAHLFKITMRVADAVRKSGLRCEGIGLF